MDLSPKSDNSIPYFKFLHVTIHTIPNDEYRSARMFIPCALLSCWAMLYSRPVQLRSIIFAVFWTFIECFLVQLSKGYPYTSFCQFWGNLLYIPFLLDVYGYYLLQPGLYNSFLYVGLFPLNIWLLEIVLSQLFILVYGRNVAWCYCKESDNLLNGVLRKSHAIQWWVLGILAWLLYPPFKTWTDTFE